MLRIDYESEGFPPGNVPNMPGVLETTWNELLWAAVTVGRPNRSCVFTHGAASVFEAVFRWSLMRMALEQGGPRAFRLRRTEAAKTLDPTEKGAVNYFLGMVFCKLFSWRLLDAPWAMHLDTFGSQLHDVLKERSRPDMIAQTNSGAWIVLESKGRISPPSVDAKNKAKRQAQRVWSIDGVAPTWHIGGVTYFRNDALNFFWRDPVPDPQRKGTAITVKTDETVWQHYYMPLLELIWRGSSILNGKIRASGAIPVEEADVRIEVHPQVLACLQREQWAEARKTAVSLRQSMTGAGFMPDGLKVVAGESWLSPLQKRM